MKANEILRALTGSDKNKNQDKKSQCKTFADIFAMVKGLTDIASVEIAETPFYFGAYCRFNRYEIETIKGDKMPGERWTIKTGKGTYSQIIPIGNDFYRAFRSLLSAFVPEVAVIENQAADIELFFT